MGMPLGARAASVSIRSATTSRSCFPRKRPSRNSAIGDVLSTVGAGAVPARPGQTSTLGRQGGRGERLEKVQLALVAAMAVTSVLAIFAAQAFLVLALLVFAVRVALRGARPRRLPIDGPILAFIVWTLLSASFSPDPGESFRTGVKKLLLFALLLVAADTLANTRRMQRVLDVLMLGGVVLASGMIIQYHLLGFDALDRRPTSFLGHWMTASGLCMGILVLAVARMAFWREPWPRPTREDLKRALLGLGALALLTVLQRLDIFAVEGERLFVAALAVAAVLMATGRGRWPNPGTGALLPLVAIPLCSWALLVSRTRSAWIGALCGLALIAVLRAPKTLWLIALLVAGVMLVRPALVVERLTVHDSSSKDRVFMWQAGFDMILDKPLFGQGPGMIPFAYEHYRWPEAPSRRVSHLHNNALQLAAERGLPCLAFWLWWVAVALADAYRATRKAAWNERWVAPGALAFLAALLMAGMFEYNFGDSEVLYVILLLAPLPYVFPVKASHVEPAGATL
jgi:O-antigen ligase